MGVTAVLSVSGKGEGKKQKTPTQKLEILDYAGQEGDAAAAKSYNTQTHLIRYFLDNFCVRIEAFSYSVVFMLAILSGVGESRSSS
jgi:hypothetical protein